MNPLLADWLRWLLARRIVDANLLYPLYAASLLLVVWVAWPRRDAGWRRLLLGAGTGTAVGGVALAVAEVGMNIGGGPLPVITRCWVVGFTAVLGLLIAAGIRAPWWRRVAGLLTVPVLLTSTVLGINKSFGMDDTLAQLLGVQIFPELPLPPAMVDGMDARRGASEALSQVWTPPVHMPTQGRTGQRRIPGAVSGFAARPAGIYLPPAALVADAPRLPVVIMMLGQPGNPDPAWVARALDPLARQHGGLAPIVVVADQIGKPTHDTLCLNTKRYGNVETYLSVDVVTWIRQNLNVSRDPRDWTIAGYSNGGQCALSLAAKHPGIWGNVVDISGEAYPGQEHPAATLRDVFGGDRTAYEAVKPHTILAHHHYSDMWAYFSFGTDDTTYGPGVRELASQAAAAGMTVHLDALPHAGHAAAALQGGLADGFSWLYPRWGLDAPA